MTSAVWFQTLGESKLVRLGLAMRHSTRRLVDVIIDLNVDAKLNFFAPTIVQFGLLHYFVN
jgi:hypothetical protein